MQSGNDESDEGLVGRAASGERAAFAELVARYAPAVRNVLRSRVGDAHWAEDLSQEVWIKVHGALASFAGRGAFRPWLFAIALNHARDALRSKLRRRPRFVQELELGEGAGGGIGGGTGDLEDSEPAPDGHMDRREQAQLVAAALKDIQEPFRTALSLVELGGLSYAEAAATSECSLGTVKSRVHRARRLFRDAFLRREAATRPPVLRTAVLTSSDSNPSKRVRLP